MFTQIGKPVVAGDAVALLLECHERIRSFLALAHRLAVARPADRDAVAEVAMRVRRYFTEALPLHAQDEEESLLPRLRGKDPRTDAALDAMVREHKEHERSLAVLVRACEALARDPDRYAEWAPALATAAEELERHLDLHLRREEGVVFPAVRWLLDRSSDLEVVKEIRARRERI